MIHTIKICAVLNGFLVNVGCQELVFETREHLLTELDAYLKNPNDVEKRYRESALHRDKLNWPTPAAPCPDTCVQQGQPANAASPVFTSR